MKRLLTTILLAVALWGAGVQPLRAERAVYDRGIELKTFIPKGQWMVGATFSYNEHVDDNFEFMSILQDITSDGYTFKVTPLVSYFVKDNISIGARFAYGRSITNLGSLSLELGDDLSFSVDNFKSVSNTYTGALFARMYLNLGESKRFGLFSEGRVAYGYSESNSSSGTGADLSGVYQLKHNLNIGFSPGITCFMDNHVAVEASVNVAGLNFNWYDQTKDQVDKGSRHSSSASFKINLLSVDIGIVFFF